MAGAPSNGRVQTASAEYANATAVASQTPEVSQENAAEEQTPKLPPTSDVKEIVRRAVEGDHHNFERAQKYTCVQRQVVKELDKHGNVKSTEIKTYDVNYYFGEFYPKLIQVDDKPLERKRTKEGRREAGEISG